MSASTAGPSRRIRVLIADDHSLVRWGLRALLEAAPDIEVVAEASNGLEALEQLALHRPDVAVFDVTMPELNGIDATRRALAALPGLHVVIVTVHGEDCYVRQALQEGASAYVLKDAAPGELEMAIRFAQRGQIYVTPAVSAGIVQAFLHDTGAPSSQLDSLTRRQRQVLQLLAEGHSTKQIARSLGLSPKTVETHRTQLMRRLDIHDVAGLVHFALRVGLVDPTR